MARIGSKQRVHRAERDCVCPKGMEVRGKVCAPVRKPQACSIRGQVLNKRGACVCPRGTEVIEGACRRVDAECAPGSQMIDGICQPIITRR